MYCINCGQEIDEGSRFCIFCGANQSSGDEEVVTAQPIKGDLTEQASVQSPKPPMDPNKKRTIVIVAVILGILAIGAVVFFTFFNKSTVNLTANLVAEDGAFYGYDGNGYLDTDYIINQIDYDMNNEDMWMLIDSIYYDYSKEEDLSNGDKITVTANYSKETADALNLKITGTTCEIEVTGLIKKFKDGSDIPDDILKELKTQAKQQLEEHFDYDGYCGLKTEYVGTYFIKKNNDSYDDSGDVLVTLYKYEVYYNDEPTPESKYIGYAYDEIYGIDSRISVDSIYDSSYFSEMDENHANYEYAPTQKEVIEELTGDYGDESVVYDLK